MRALRTLAAASLAVVSGACADVPTTAAPAAGDPALALTASATLGQIEVGSVVEYSDRWTVHFSTPNHSTISSWRWSHSGGVGANPWGNTSYKYIVERYKTSGPGCVVAELVTKYTNGTSSYDSEAVKVGGYTGMCALPA